LRGVKKLGNLVGMVGTILNNGFDLSMHRRDCTDALWAATLAANKDRDSGMRIPKASATRSLTRSRPTIEPIRSLSRQSSAQAVALPTAFLIDKLKRRGLKNHVFLAVVPACKSVGLMASKPPLPDKQMAAPADDPAARNPARSCQPRRRRASQYRRQAVTAR